MNSPNPAFLGVGPLKTGTSWLYTNLNRHPEVRMPPRKEIHYFWERYDRGSVSPLRRLVSGHWQYRSERRFLLQRLAGHGRRLIRLEADLGGLLWDLRFAFSQRSERWYLSLFDRELPAGDISPHYYRLPDCEVARIAELLPGARIILPIRDPIEREWSEARMVLCQNRKKDVDEVSTERFLRYLDQPENMGRVHPVDAITRWRKFFRGRVLVLFFDDLVERPIKTFETVCRHLEIAPPDADLSRRLEETVNPGVPGAMPGPVKKDLVEKHRQVLHDLVEHFPESPHPTRWLRRCRC